MAKEAVWDWRCIANKSLLFKKSKVFGANMKTIILQQRWGVSMLDLQVKK